MTKPYRSRINPDKQISRDRWVVSLVAKEKGENPEHAFIIVEGLAGDNWETVIFRRYDFVPVDRQAAQSPGGSEGRVNMKEINQNKRQYDEEALAFFFWGNIMNDIGEVQGAHGASWEVSADEAFLLHQTVEKDQQNPPHYHVLGKYSAVAVSSSSSHGHNCYSWASAKLRRLNDEIKGDKRLGFKLFDSVGSQTTRHLKPPSQVSEEPTSPKPSCLIL